MVKMMMANIDFNNAETNANICTDYDENHVTRIISDHVQQYTEFMHVLIITGNSIML